MSGLAHKNVLDALTEAVRRPDASLALLLVDLADVPRLQGRLGFEISAQLLQNLSDAFSRAIGERASVIRFGDGRFCVIVSAIRNSGHAVLAGEKLARVADDVMNASAIAIKPEINIGIALYPSQSADPGGLLRQAQLAAAAARKRTVRTQVYDDSCAAEVLMPLELGDAFAQALENGELTVYYQPKVRIADNQPAGVEALMRWMRDDKPVAPPDVFIPLAEQTGLIHNATWYALSNALRQAAECDGLPVAVNITPGMLHHREFPDMVRTAVATWGVKDKALTLEVTEGGLIVDFAQASERLSALRDLGLRISIDDFGTGYSSLSYFKKIPADELKIDKSFITRMREDPADEHLVDTILRLARQFKLETVAEGVEDGATLDMLARMGCDYAQGFFFSQALSGPQLKEWLSARGG